MRNNPECAGCKAEMTEGFVIDHGEGYYRLRQLWVSGSPESSFWSGFKTKDRESFYVSGYRCPGCGRLDLFANEPADAKSIFS